jgi:putative ABC transport system ATP-binding protein
LAHRPGELSGGEQQRVAIARALVHRPAVIFADEPTGNLDSQTGGEVLKFLRLAVEQFEQTVVMVTHDPAAAAHTHRVVFLRDGRIIDEIRAPSVEVILSRITGAETGAETGMGSETEPA